MAPESGEPPPSALGISGFRARSRTRWRVTSPSVFCRNQSVSRRISARSIGSSASRRRSRFKHAAGLVEIFGDDDGADDRHVALGQKTGKVPAGLSVRNSLRRLHGFSSISASSSPYSPKARRTKRQLASKGWWKRVSMGLRSGIGLWSSGVSAGKSSAARSRGRTAHRAIGADRRRDKQVVSCRRPSEESHGKPVDLRCAAARPAWKG